MKNVKYIYFFIFAFISSSIPVDRSGRPRMPKQQIKPQAQIKKQKPQSKQKAPIKTTSFEQQIVTAQNNLKSLQSQLKNTRNKSQKARLQKQIANAQRNLKNLQAQQKARITQQKTGQEPAQIIKAQPEKSLIKAEQEGPFKILCNRIYKIFSG